MIGPINYRTIIHDPDEGCHNQPAEEWLTGDCPFLYDSIECRAAHGADGNPMRPTEEEVWYGASCWCPLRSGGVLVHAPTGD